MGPAGDPGGERSRGSCLKRVYKALYIAQKSVEPLAERGNFGIRRASLLMILVLC